MPLAVMEGARKRMCAARQACQPGEVNWSRICALHKVLFSGHRGKAGSV